MVITGTGANIAGTANITGNAAIANIVINNYTIASSITNGNLNFAGNGVGGIVLNSGGGSSNVVINGNTSSGFNNLFYADATTGRIGILTNSTTANAALAINSTNSILLPVGNTLQRPTGVAGMLRFNNTSNQIEYYDGYTWNNTGATFTVISSDSFVGDNSTLVYTLSQSTTTNGVLVSVNGVLQTPVTAYGVSGTTLTFTEAPQSGDVIDVRTITTTASITSLAAGTSQIQLTDTGAGTGNLITSINGNIAFYVNTTSIVQNLPVVSAPANVSVGTSVTTVDSFAMGTYRSARYRIQVSHASAGYEVSEVLVIHNGTTATQTQFGVVYTGASSLGNVSVTTSSGNVLVQYTGVNTSNTVRASAFYTPL